MKLPYLETARLRLRPPRPDDAEALFAYRSDARANRFQGWVPERPEEARAFLSRLPSEPGLPGTWYQLMIEERDGGRLIGDIGLRFDANGDCGIGYTLAREHRGHGLATEAVRAAIGYLFGPLDRRRVHADVLPANEASIRLLRRIGFAPTGAAPEADEEERWTLDR
jgi:RimJ/RimL family protein N-acetyltransferase